MENKEQKAVRLGNKYFDVDSFTERAYALLQDVKKVEEVLQRQKMDVSITELARQMLIEELGKELPNLKEVPGPEEVTKSE